MELKEAVAEVIFVGVLMEAAPSHFSTVLLKSIRNGHVSPLINGGKFFFVGTCVLLYPIGRRSNNLDTNAPNDVKSINTPANAMLSSWQETGARMRQDETRIPSQAKRIVGLVYMGMGESSVLLLPLRRSEFGITVEAGD